ncbi:unnamed protein product [Brassica rapa subsp. trilocularis]
MLKTLPRNASLSSSPASMASDKCQKEKRKTVNGEYLLWGSPLCTPKPKERKDQWPQKVLHLLV